VVNLVLENAARSFVKPFDGSNIWTDHTMSAPKLEKELRQLDYAPLSQTKDSLNVAFLVFLIQSQKPKNLFFGTVE